MKIILVSIESSDQGLSNGTKIFHAVSIDSDRLHFYFASAGRRYSTALVIKTTYKENIQPCQVYDNAVYLLSELDLPIFLAVDLLVVRDSTIKLLNSRSNSSLSAESSESDLGRNKSFHIHRHTCGIIHCNSG